MEEELRRKEEEERLQLEEQARKAKQPRHEDLEMYTLLEDQEADESMALTRTLAVTLESDQSRRVGTMTDYDPLYPMPAPRTVLEWVRQPDPDVGGTPDLSAGADGGDADDVNEYLLDGGNVGRSYTTILDGGHA